VARVLLLNLMVIITPEMYLRSMIESEFGTLDFGTLGNSISPLPSSSKLRFHEV
jgi:hypothetical protein